MRELRTSGSVGAAGEQSPAATRHSAPILGQHLDTHHMDAAYCGAVKAGRSRAAVSVNSANNILNCHQPSRNQKLRADSLQPLARTRVKCGS